MPDVISQIAMSQKLGTAILEVAGKFLRFSGIFADVLMIGGPIFPPHLLSATIASDFVELPQVDVEYVQVQISCVDGLATVRVRTQDFTTVNFFNVDDPVVLGEKLEFAIFLRALEFFWEGRGFARRHLEKNENWK